MKLIAADAINPSAKLPITISEVFEGVSMATALYEIKRGKVEATSLKGLPQLHRCFSPRIPRGRSCQTEREMMLRLLGRFRYEELICVKSTFLQAYSFNPPNPGSQEGVGKIGSDGRLS